MKEELKKLIQIVVSEQASDLHLSEGRYPTIRVAGALIPVTKSQELTEDNLSTLLNLVLTPDQRERFIQNKDMDFAFEAGGVRFRGNAFYQQGEVSIALRLINTDIRSFEELGLPEILETFAKKEQGFFLVVGPTGHGKSTTLATIIDTINRNRSEHIVTIEDPVEFVFEQKSLLLISARLDSIPATLPLRSRVPFVKTSMF